MEELEEKTKLANEVVRNMHSTSDILNMIFFISEFCKSSENIGFRSTIN